MRNEWGCWFPASLFSVVGKLSERDESKLPKIWSSISGGFRASSNLNVKKAEYTEHGMAVGCSAVFFWAVLGSAHWTRFQ